MSIDKLSTPSEQDSSAAPAARREDEIRFASTIDRDSAVDIMASVEAIDRLLDDCPHGIAKKIKAAMAVFEQIADDAFPGGYACGCICCDKPIGYAEAVSLGDESCCPTCWEERKADMAACDHEYGLEGDVHGDPIRSCMKCGHSVDENDDEPRGLSAGEAPGAAAVNNPHPDHPAGKEE